MTHGDDDGNDDGDVGRSYFGYCCSVWHVYRYLLSSLSCDWVNFVIVWRHFCRPTSLFVLQLLITFSASPSSSSSDAAMFICTGIDVVSERLRQATKAEIGRSSTPGEGTDRNKIACQICYPPNTNDPASVMHH